MDVELLRCMGILGCGQNIFMRVCQRGTIYLAHMKRPASSYLAVEDMTNLENLENCEDWSIDIGNWEVFR